MISIIVIDSGSAAAAKKAIEMIERSERADFLFLAENVFFRKLAEERDNVREIDISKDYGVILERSRSNIVSFFCSFPQKRAVGKNFHERFSEDGASPWWMMNFADKAPDAGGVINRLFHLDLIDHFVLSARYDAGAIISEDENFRSCVSGLLSRRKISPAEKAEDLPQSRKSALSAAADFLGIYAKSSTAVLKLVAEKLICILFSPGNREDEATAPKAKVAFHSWYPAHWQNSGNEVADRYYSDLPDYVLKNSSTLEPFYVFKLKWYEKNIIKLIYSLVWAGTGGIKFDFTGKYIPVAGLVSFYLDPSRILNYLKHESEPEYIKNFEYIGVNIFRIASGEVRNSYFFDYPYNRIVAESVAACAKCNKISIFVNFLELYAYARSIVARFRKDPELSKVSTVAFQHSTVTRYNPQFNFSPCEVPSGGRTDGNNPLHVPVPDHFILSGTAAREVLLESGIAEGTLHVTGSPRYEFMAGMLNRNAPRSGKTRILIATVSERNDSRNILEFSSEALEGSGLDGGGIETVVKMHPMCDVSDMVEDLRLKSSGRFSYRLSHDSIYGLISDSDVVITSNSMTGLEALVMGAAVVLLGDPARINLSPLTGSLEFGRIICYSKKCFTDRVGRVIRGERDAFNGDEIRKLVEKNYFSLDKKANERIVKLLEEINAGKY